jgi:hypothetical protein
VASFSVTDASAPRKESVPNPVPPCLTESYLAFPLPILEAFGSGGVAAQEAAEWVVVLETGSGHDSMGLPVGLRAVEQAKMR